jgi:rhomboid family GlyGly-CTERM serine protease
LAETGRSPGPIGWAALAGLLALGAAIAWPLPREALDWQPALGITEAWRAWTAVFVHYSPLHLGANIVGTALVAALGVAARVPARAPLAWLAAWPLTQWGLVWQPELAHYGGLSGVLHAGVAVLTVHLLVARRGAAQRIGLALAAGLALKLLVDAPWEGALRRPAGWDIDVAPMAHVSGVAAGAICAAAAEVLARLRPTIAR